MSHCDQSWGLCLHTLSFVGANTPPPDPPPHLRFRCPWLLNVAKRRSQSCHAVNHIHAHALQYIRLHKHITRFVTAGEKDLKTDDSASENPNRDDADLHEEFESNISLPGSKIRYAKHCRSLKRFLDQNFRCYQFDIIENVKISKYRYRQSQVLNFSKTDTNIRVHTSVFESFLTVHCSTKIGLRP